MCRGGGSVKQVEIWCSTSGAEGEFRVLGGKSDGGRSKCSRLDRLSLKFLTILYVLLFLMYLAGLDVCPACVCVLQKNTYLEMHVALQVMSVLSQRCYSLMV